MFILAGGVKIRRQRDILITLKKGLVGFVRHPHHIEERACGADLIVRREIGGRDPLNPARQ